MENKRFTKNDNGFVCQSCGCQVPPLGYTSRNHCPRCLSSLHVDINPGDRQNDCGGLMLAVSARPDAKKGFIVTHKCTKCAHIGHNKAAEDDDMELLIKLTASEADFSK